jgi:hypothetical protein
MTLHLTNWSSTKLHGPGRKLTIMAAPRAWEHGDGRVGVLVPNHADLRAMQARQIDVEDYASRWLAGCADVDLRPGVLADDRGVPVADGDTLLCACSREQARLNRCHRCWAARLLVGAGWTVVLDGSEVTL